MLLESKPSSKSQKALPPASAAPILIKPLTAKQNLSLWQTLSLRTKATILGILVSVIPVLIVGASTYSLIDRSLEAEIKEEALKEAEDVIEKTDRFMAERYRDILVLANLPIFNSEKVKQSTTPAQRQKVLSDIANTYGIYDSITVMNTKGDDLIASNNAPLTNHADDDYFKAVISTGKRFVSQPRFSKSANAVVVFIAAPIKDINSGKLIGVVRSRIPVKFIDESIKGEFEGSSSTYHLIAKDGNIFVSNDNEALTNPKIESHFPSFKTAQAGGKSIVTEFFEPLEKRQVFGVYAPWESDGGLDDLGWDVFLAEDSAAAFKTRTELVQVLLIGIISSALVATIIAILISNQATQPITRAAKAVAKIGEGDLDVRLKVDGGDEIAQLGSNINLMAEQIEELIDSQKQETEKANLLSTISLQIRQTLDLDTICNKIVESAQSALQCDRTVIYRFKPNFSGYISHESVSPGLPLAIEDLIGDPCIPNTLIEAYKQGRVVPTDDVEARGYHPDHISLLHRLKVKSNLVTPILIGQELFGLLVAHHCQSTHKWRLSEINFLSQMAIQTGTAIEQAGFVERLEVARQEARSEADSRADQQKSEKESLQKSALELLMQVDPVSRGDLTIRANVTEDEIGTIADSYNSLIRSLRKIVGDVQSAALEVTNNTQENEKTVKTVAIEAQQQSESIDQALAQIQVMAQSIVGVESRANQAEQQMLKANQVVKAGDAAMNKTVAGISAIRETVSEATEKVKRLDIASQKISKVVKLIGGFAAQTNLLALNASIEAARAGEDGEGFGVVANEVRALAQRSAAATNEIRLLIEEIQTQTQSVVKAMESGSEQVITGTRLVEDSRQQLNQITVVNSQVNQLVQEIAKAAATQSLASNSVGKRIQTASAIAADTTKQTDQVAKSFSELLAVAEKLQISVSQFKV